MTDPIQLPSPVDAAKVDEWVAARLKTKGLQRRAKLERDLPKELVIDGSAFLTIEHSLSRMVKAERVRMHPNGVELRK